MLLAATLFGCSDAYRYLQSGEVGWAMKQALRDRHADKLELARLTQFQWDEFFVFGPYQPTRAVCERLGLAERDCKSTITRESADDGEMLMVFRTNGKVVHTEMHLRWHGDFVPAPWHAFSRESAVFSVSRDDGNWLTLRAAGG
jgi:hypothetical protein